MFWPNEPAHIYPRGQQLGPREAFEVALAEGQITALETFSYLREKADVLDDSQFLALTVEKIQAFRPDIMFVQHVTGSGLEAPFWKEVRAASGDATMVYHEADPFDRFVKRIDRSMKAFLPHAQIVYSCGMGQFMALMGKYSSAEFRYLPHSVQASRFAIGDPRATKKEFDFVMIGNRGVRKRLKFAYLPGGGRRAEFARQLSEVFGSRFALFGRGWEKLRSSRGLLPFDDQATFIQKARVSVNWDHFDKEPYYFSDRLPISLAAGVPHVTTWHPGYEHQFAGCPGLYTCRSVREAIDTCRWLITKTDEQLIEEGLAGRKWILKNLESVNVYRTALAGVIDYHRGHELARDL